VSDEPARVVVELVFCARPGHIDQQTLSLPAGATVADALRESGVLGRHALAAADLKVGIWARKVDLQTPLREHDRVELYRPLTADPKEARRLRYKQHLEKFGKKR